MERYAPHVKDLASRDVGCRLENSASTTCCQNTNPTLEKHNLAGFNAQRRDTSNSALIIFYKIKRF